ncbi:uncharacterized protein PG986_014456 [Apiospora aurea]|uniref:C2H2-type domain-containing protein n=1 Tax=Apiospora aurea TaxID=335848 RepID=A0ABR1PT43_9PEZI
MSSLSSSSLPLESIDPQALTQYLYHSPQEVLPPTTELGGYPVDVKPEYAPSMSPENNMLLTPMRTLHLQCQMIDSDFMGTSIPPSATAFESYSPHTLQQPHPLHDSMTAGSPPMALSSPLEFTPSYTFNYRPWTPQMTENHTLDCNFYRIPPLSAMDIRIASSQANAPSSLLRSNVQQIPVSKFPKAMHVCDFPGCEKQTGFKRREHLRRHQNTKHGLRVEVTCEFCRKTFNRQDNWRQHLRLHTEPNRPMTRTHYHEKAIENQIISPPYLFNPDGIAAARPEISGLLVAAAKLGAMFTIAMNCDAEPATSFTSAASPTKVHQCNGCYAVQLPVDSGVLRTCMQRTIMASKTRQPLPRRAQNTREKLQERNQFQDNAPPAAATATAIPARNKRHSFPSGGFAIFSRSTLSFSPDSRGQPLPLPVQRVLARCSGRRTRCGLSREDWRLQNIITAAAVAAGVGRRLRLGQRVQHVVDQVHDSVGEKYVLLHDLRRVGVKFIARAAHW